MNKFKVIEHKDEGWDWTVHSDESENDSEEPAKILKSRLKKLTKRVDKMENKKEFVAFRATGVRNRGFGGTNVRIMQGNLKL